MSEKSDRRGEEGTDINDLAESALSKARSRELIRQQSDFIDNLAGKIEPLVENAGQTIEGDLNVKNPVFDSKSVISLATTLTTAATLILITREIVAGITTYQIPTDLVISGTFALGLIVYKIIYESADGGL